MRIETARTAQIISAVFSDETCRFRIPCEPDAGRQVELRVRTLKDSALRAMLVRDEKQSITAMDRCGGDELFDYYSTRFLCPDGPVRYVFVIECEQMRIICDKTGARRLEPDEEPYFDYAFHFTPGFHVPEWSKGAVQYQILVDRFCRGDDKNDVADNEYYYVNGHAEHVDDWSLSEIDSTGDIRRFYGGDLQGVLKKLDYLSSLGVEAIYFNPLFVSPSSHKYDVQDYEHIDPHLAVIADDIDHDMQHWEKNNGYAPRYIRRVTSITNLEKSDALFAHLCREIHRRGMKIILDGVFNHCGSFNKWMDREGIYLNKKGFAPGAYQDKNSPYRSYFKFSSDEAHSQYEGWWGYETLPKLNYEQSPELCEKIFSIACKWASPPYSIDGWRLDVAPDLGHSKEFNHKFWREFRRRVKAVNPDLLILAEHYGDPFDWLHGDQWDTVMNYDAFMEPLSYYLTGMEKHSDSVNNSLYLNGPAFFDTIFKKMARFEAPALACAMNELSNHDHSRFLTRTNRAVGRLASKGHVAAGEGISKAVLRQAVTVQMTWPGNPTIYYGDEAGQVGWTDPDCRRTYPWGAEDNELIGLHKALTALRRKYGVLKNGSIKPLYSAYGIIAYARFDDDECAVVACNSTKAGTNISMRVCDAGARDGDVFSVKLKTGAEGYDSREAAAGQVQDGRLSMILAPQSSVILINSGNQGK